MDILTKIVTRQDACFKTTPSGSNETSINLSHEISAFLADESGDVTFKIYKEDYVKALGTICVLAPLYYKKDTKYYSIQVYDFLSHLIDVEFGNQMSTTYSVSLLKREDGRHYLNNLKAKNGFNVRSFLMEKYSKLEFSKDLENNLILRVLSSTSEYEDVVADEAHKEIAGSLQQIYYGAPGTGKSFAINDVCAKYENYRTTFHPDSDYASFVGSYKPITQQTPLYGVQGQPIKDSEGEIITEDRIVYRYVFQSFLKAYIAAWKEQQNEKPQPVFLIVEEINRGNCAQIFGDIFQLLDRNSEGFSDYPIEADEDLANELRKVLNGLTIANKEHINALYKGGKDVVAKVMSGAQLLLPNNLYIWATMNTSDQSLFPIDSAFKRRWDWKYIKIKDSNENYIVRFSNGHSYDWWKFVSEINKRIEGGDIQQEDKKLGYFFAKAKDSIISAETLVSKVLFYLYSDVFKDFGFEEDFFKDENGEVMTFASYFDGAGDIDETRVEKFVTNLGLTPIGSEAAEVSDDTETMEEPETAEENSEE
jgi:hypothetical protein